MFNCLYKNEPNLIFSLVEILLIRKFYIYSPQYTFKLIIHIITFSFILDIIYLFLIFPLSESKDPNSKWNELSFIRALSLYISILIILTKLLITFIFYREYNRYPQIKEGYLKNFDYENKTDPNKPTTPIINLQRMNYFVNY